MLTQHIRCSSALGMIPIFATMLVTICCRGAVANSEPAAQLSPTNIFAPASTPAQSIFGLAIFVLAVTAAIFVVVFTLLAYSVAKFRKRNNDDSREPAQVYGSNQIEVAWTVIPVLIVVALFMAAGRVIADVQRAERPNNALEVIAIGHQFWWEYRYPALGIVTANELHVPVSDASHPTPTFIKLLSADTDHSFWIPRLAGKTDLIPNHPNSTWIDPHETGFTSDSVRNIVGHNTPRCSCEFTFSRMMTSRDGLRNKVDRCSQAIPLRRDDGSSKPPPASTATL